MVLLFAAVIIAAAIVWGCVRIASELKATREDAARARTMNVMSAFLPAAGAVGTDSRALLVWQPLARTARVLFPEAFAEIDRAAGAAFPFSADQIQAAHAQWTADWLAWEASHDAEYKLKAAIAEEDAVQSGGSAAARARLNAVEREKLGLYQRRYAEYIRIGKALQALQPLP